MAYCFNKMNSKVLKFDVLKDIDKIRFNHYIMRKENINRLIKDLPDGQFSLTISEVQRELNLSKRKAYNIIKEFENIGIIKNIIKGNLSRNNSVYEYVVKDFETDLSKGKDIEKSSDINAYTNTNVKDMGSDINSDLMNLKKENLKRDLNKNNIYASIIDYLNEKSTKNFKSTTKKTKSVIDARINEGFDLDDFYKVIDIKCSQWLYSDMAKYLRPETLFSNKFEGYLNEINTNKADDSNDCEIWDIKFDY